MPKPIIQHLCPVCEQTYDNPEDAANCYKSPRGRFVPGDIVWDGRSSGFVYRITHIDPIGSPAIDGAALEFVQELRKAAHMINQPKDGYWVVGSFWCRAQLYPIKDARELVDELTKRAQAATTFLQQVKGSHERHPSTEPTPIEVAVQTHANQ